MQVSQRRGRDTNGSERAGEDGNLLILASPGKPKRRLKKRNSFYQTKRLVFFACCAVVVTLVSLLAWIGPTIFVAVGGRSLYHSSITATLIHLNPADYAHEPKGWDERRAAALYRPREAMEGIGDTSHRYANLREYVDHLLPDDFERSRVRVDELKTHTFGLIPMKEDDGQVTYDIYNCPDDPPEGYPYQWTLTDILDHWPTDETEPRDKVYQGLCVFDYNKDFDKAMRYRKAELPFIVVNDPAVLKSVERWSIPGYVESMLGDREYGCEYTENNHFMYGSNEKKHKKGKKADAAKAEDKPFFQPFQHLHMKYSDWVKHAEAAEEHLGPDKPHWYFRLITCGTWRNKQCDKGDLGSEYIWDELPFFQPKENLYMVDPSAQIGVHCRFGMKGLIAENHWDNGRNSILVLKGMRRYILAHPKECNNLVLYPKDHPSARHSKMDWSHYDTKAHPEFAQATANEVILQPGQLLFLPATWFHYIISLNTNMQCNTRSGNPPDVGKWVKHCN